MITLVTEGKKIKGAHKAVSQAFQTCGLIPEICSSTLDFQKVRTSQAEWGWPYQDGHRDQEVSHHR